MADETGTDRVRAGDFSALPLPLTWAKSYDLARMIDDYAVAESFGDPRPGGVCLPEELQAHQRPSA